MSAFAGNNTSDACVNTGDMAWVSLSTILVLAMCPALALFEAGLLRSQHTVSVLMQVLVGVSMSSVLWFLFGFSFVYGESLGGVIGNPTSFPGFTDLLHGCLVHAPTVPSLSFAMFQMMFAAICPLLLTGAYAERLRWRVFVIFTFFWEILVYYPVAHWVWGGGWLERLGALDFAGGIVLHTTAGAGALVSALVLGRRKGFIEKHGEFPPSSLPMACVGGGLLWMGWFGFNAGSVFQASSSTALVITNTQLASATSMMVWVLVAWARGRPHAADALNGAIAGLAGVTPASGYISPWAAFLLGILLGFASFYAVRLFRFRLRIDDALDVSSVHGVTGVVGSLAIGFATETGISGTDNDGLFFGRHSAYLLGVQVLAVVVVGAYTAAVTWLLFKTLCCFGPISLQAVSEHEGLDTRDHAIEAYNHHHPLLRAHSSHGSDHDDDDHGALGH